MQHLSFRSVRFAIMVAMFALLAIIAGAYTIRAHADAPRGSTMPGVSDPQTYLKINKQDQVIFSPDRIHMYAQIQNVDITNTTGLTIALYLNGQYLESLPPGGWVGTGFTYPGTDMYTIPNTNPNAQLTITVKPHVIPNSNLKVGTSGQIVFSPHWLSCAYSLESICLTITNTTTQTINVYLNGVFYLTMYPNQVANLQLNGPGTSVFTIPATNPNAKLTVVGR